ncbi:MAG: HAD-IA family hydrolase [Bacteroides sp.]|nr:HAD-IA family hydrolase [Bacteroides sp.]
MRPINFPKNLRAALIDMDGVLYDSMPHHAKAWHRMFSEIGIDTVPEEFFLYEGMTGGDTINLIIQRECGRDATPEEKKQLYARKAELFVNSGQKQPMPGADLMLKTFMERGIDRVLVTGSAQSSLLNSLNRDYPGAFQKGKRVTALDVAHGKPDPEPYQKGAGIVNADSSEVIVVENAPLGVRAGKAAGFFTIAVTTGPIPREEFEKEGADMIFSSMKEFAEWLDRELPGVLVSRLDKCVAKFNPATMTVVTDANVDKAVMSLFKHSEVIEQGNKVVLSPGEQHKNLKSVMQIWDALEAVGATRKSIVVNIGGGLVTDIGGFAAATFKRGIRFINVPTTLLGAVDAATGGKTGINYNGLKNEIGAFHQHSEVIISSLPLRTLSDKEIMSGYAEMLKTGLIADEVLYNKLLDVEGILNDYGHLEEVMQRCVLIKEDVVNRDPEEKGLRKILNFGHTAGHAFESLSFRKGTPLAHGEAVAHGILVELILSHMTMGLESNEIHRYANTVLKQFYPSAGIRCEDIPTLIDLMAHDKKNSVAGCPNFTLLRQPGVPEIDCVPVSKDIEAALEVYMDMMG